MLEKMADVVSDHIGSYGYFTFAKDRKACRALARDALQAIREPDHWHCLVGQTHDQTSGAVGANRIGEVFTAVIDAILAEGDKTP